MPQGPARSKCALNKSQAGSYWRLDNLLHRCNNDLSFCQELGDALCLTADQNYALPGVPHLLAAIQHALELAAILLTMTEGAGRRCRALS